MSGRALVPLVPLIFFFGAALLGASARQQPVFRSAADLVEVDAVVTGRDGRFIRDLRPDEIEIFEEGRPQRLQSLYLVENGVASEASAAGATLPSASAARPVRRAFFFLFDQEHLSPGSFTRVRGGAEAFLTSDFRDGRDLGALYAIGATGTVRMTAARDDLMTSLRALRPRAESRARTAEFRDWPRIVGEAEALRIDQGDAAVLKAAALRACQDEPVRNCAEQAEVLLLEKARRFMRDARSAAARALQALAAAAQGLAGLEGRKTLVFMTDGFFADENRAQLRQITGAAGRAGVAIYVIDARGLDKTAAGRTLQDVMPPDTANLATDVFDTKDDVADQLADGTGGLVVRNVNDGAKALATIAKDTSSYYVIGYTPGDATWDGRFRRIEVRVKRDGVLVRARHGYFAHPRSAPLIAVAPQPAPPAPLTASSVVPSALSPVAELAPARPQAGDRVRALIEQVNPTKLGPTTANEAAQRGWAHYERGDLEGAARELREATAERGAPVWAYYALGQAAFGLRRFAEAIAAWRRVRDAVPEFEPVYFDLVDAHLQAADPREAIAVLRDAERRWPRDPEVHNALGVVQVGRGALDDSIASFRKAIAAAPDAALAYFNLGRALEMRYARTRRWMPATAGWVGNAADRRDAVASYQKYLELGGPFEQSAREGLARLEWNARN